MMMRTANNTQRRRNLPSSQLPMLLISILILSCSTLMETVSSFSLNSIGSLHTKAHRHHHHHLEHRPMVNQRRRTSSASDGSSSSSSSNSGHGVVTVTTRGTTRLAALLGGDENEDNNNNGDNDKTPGLPFTLPSLSQLLSIWLVGVSANRVVQSLSNAGVVVVGGDDTSLDINLVLNIALNSVILLGSSYFLFQTIQGIDYSALEDYDQKSLAKQAGVWAMAGEVPNNTTTTTNGKTNNNNNNGNVVVVDGKSYQVATFAGGCFWGTELHFQRIPGVFATCVGYTQGSVEKPSYEQVCSGTTGHTEGLQLLYDPEECSYERLLNQLFATINPTLLNRVGNDSGTQYRHGVYTHSEEQAATAAAVFDSLRNGPYQGSKIVTELKPATVFWPAENYHQRYLEKRGQSAEKNCEEKVRCYG